MSKPNVHECTHIRQSVDKIDRMITEISNVLRWAESSHLTHGEKNGLIGYSHNRLLDIGTELRKILPPVQMLEQYDTNEPEDLPF